MKTADTPKLIKSTADPNGIPVVGYNPKGELSVGNATMANFATFLQRFVIDRPAVDQTGIAGRFDLVLRWTPDELRDGKPDDLQADTSAPPSLFTAIKEQLGLKLQPTKAATDVFLIDRVEHPSNN
ncbi:MAG: TIGR03435 family protein [Edaphobacter sp.]